MRQIKLFELKEIECWEDVWNHVGLFESYELAEQFRDQRIIELKKSFDEETGKFGDWYRWSISARTLYKKDLPKDAEESIQRLKTQTAKDKLDKHGEWKIEYIEDLATVCDLYFVENNINQ